MKKLFNKTNLILLGTGLCISLKVCAQQEMNLPNGEVIVNKTVNNTLPLQSLHHEQEIEIKKSFDKQFEGKYFLRFENSKMNIYSCENTSTVKAEFVSKEDLEIWMKQNSNNQ